MLPTHWPDYFGADAVRTGEAVPPKLYGMSAWDYIERTADEYCTSKRVFR
jgi:hypothetical protein